MAAEKTAPVFGESTKQSDMATISRPLHTGITAVDSLTPIGKGQNMLVVGGLDLGRRELAMDAVVHQVLTLRGGWGAEVRVPCFCLSSVFGRTLL